MFGKLNNEQVQFLLSSQVTGRLVCTDGLQPYIVPVSYTYDGEYIYGQTNEGLKLNILRKNPNVCFEVDVITNTRNWQSIIVYGKFEELENETAEKARSILFSRVFQLMTSTALPAYGDAVNGNVDDSTRIRHVMYRIKIDESTGRFEKQ